MGLGTGGGLSKANWAANKAMELRNDARCTMHPDRQATFLIGSWDGWKPACSCCAEYATAHGYEIHQPAD